VLTMRKPFGAVLSMALSFVMLGGSRPYHGEQGSAPSAFVVVVNITNPITSIERE
jgi:hypothetical protein